MDAATLATLSRLLDDALNLEPHEQQAWLDSLGPEYDALKPRLARLLSAHFAGGTSGLLRTLPELDSSGTLEGAPPDADAPEPGATVGSYRLVRELAAGGMGSVWLAERRDGLVQRPVALKLPRGAWRRLGLAERMAREREILAALNHAHIARLYDAGVADDGQPYLALEYVDGSAIDRYCRDRQLDVAARLRLFLQVVDAVTHAHSRLVVHRDLKPSNILVTGDGHVRLLDFGIAKLLEEESSTRDSAITQASGRILTPDYASPEQIRGGPIGTASDVYSLGVILYELLTGNRPYRLKRASPAALEEAILEAELVPPSQAVSDRSLRRTLRRDLDWIVAKAMAKSPESRYLSAAALGADIERYLQQQPVEAVAPRASYRVAKFVRRHRIGVAAALVIALALIAAVVGTTIGLVRARRAEAEAQASAEAARTEATTADRVTRFLLQLFDGTMAEQTDGRNVTAREMLDRGAARVREELAQEPIVQARLLQSLGNAYNSLGLYAEARPLVEEAVAVARGLGPRGEPELAKALLTSGQLLRRLDEAAAAERAVREAIAIRERLNGTGSVELGPLLNELALMLRTKAPDEALQLYRRTYDLLVAAHGPDNGDAGVVLANIGAIQTRTRRYKEAQQSLTQALAVVSAQHGENDPRAVGIYGNLALVERELGNIERAIELQTKDLELSTRALGPNHPNIGISWLNIARLSQRRGAWAVALTQVETALAIFRQHFAPRHMLIITSDNSRALYLLVLGRTDDARQLLEEVLTREAESADGRVAMLVSRLQLADVNRMLKRFDRALALTQQVLDDPLAAKDLKIMADAHWARACVLAADRRVEEATAAREHARGVHNNDQRATPADRLYAEARYAASAADTPGAIRFLNEAVANGFSNPIVLVDPTFAGVREAPAFAAVANAVRRPAATDAARASR